MKKLLLGLGTTSLAMLPIIVAASCSSTTTETVLKSEVAKLNKSFESKDTQQTSSKVVNNINNASTNVEKLIYLGTVIELPTISKGFIVEIKTAMVDSSITGSVNIDFTVLETATEEEASGILKITGLSTTKIPTLETEAAKFAKPIKTKTSSTTTNVVDKVNSASGLEAKKAALETFVDIPTLASGFTLSIKSARINNTINTQVDVDMTITEEAKKSVDVTLMISGLTSTAKPTLETEAKRFNTSLSTTVEWLLTSAAVNQINSQETPEGKKTELLKIAPLFEPNAGFTVTVGNASINAKKPTLMDVALTITDNSLTTNNTREVTFTVENLWQHSIQSQVAEFGTVPTTSPTTTLSGIINTIASATTPEAKLAELKKIAVVPNLDTGFTLELVGAFDSPSKQFLLVTFRIHQRSSISNATRLERTTFRVTGLKI